MKERDVHKLIAESGGICNFPECGEKLIYKYKDDTFVKLVEFAHIIGESPEGPRGHPTYSELMERDPENIILLCVKHHKVVDHNETEYPVVKLKQMKKKHIQWVSERLESLKEATWTLVIHSGNVTETGVPFLDKELIYRDFYGTHIIAETEELIFNEFLTKTKNWLKFKKIQEEWWEIFSQMDKPKKFIICSINFIPLVIQLGYLIHNTNTFEIFQYHPDENSWNWKQIKGEQADREFFNIELFEIDDKLITEIALSISISGTVKDKNIIKAIGKDIKIIKISVNNPNRTWLKFREQLLEFQNIYMSLLDKVVQVYPNLKKMHIFYAGPTPMAFIIGSHINPTIHPQLILYNYYGKDSPKYTRAFKIN